MMPGAANDDLDPAAPRAAVSSRTPLFSRTGVRMAVLAAAAILAVISTLIVAYELALARVPEHRAALERLVRAQTGLDVRFNELGLRWGWYGPEAVFRRVELGEPGRPSALLRAPELVVGFDAWRTLQTGQLAAGRITLVAPDIDLERLTRAERPAVAGRPLQGVRSPAGAAMQAAASTIASRRTRILERWRGGRIDLQGGTLRMPDPNGSANPVTVQIRSASLRHSDTEWSGFGLVYLPERLGRAARIVVQLRGDPGEPHTLSGGVRFEGMRLAFSGWREVLAGRPSLARSLPATGSGDITLQLTLKNGRVEKASGQVKAEDVTFGTPAWLDVSNASPAVHGVLKLDYIAGDWRFVRRSEGAQVQLEKLLLRRDGASAPLPPVSIEFSTGHLHGSVSRAPLDSVAAVAQWLAPQLLPSGVTLKGTTSDIEFDWNMARVEGQRLAASAMVSEGTVASTSGSFELSGLRARLTGSESRIAIELEAPAAQLELAPLQAHLLETMKLASVLQITRSDAGWRLSTDDLTIDHDSGRLKLSGTLSSAEESDEPVLDAHGTVAHADVAKLQSLFEGGAERVLGSLGTRVTAGRIEDAQFELRGPVDELLRGGDAFRGSLTLRDAHMVAQDAWPELHALDAQLEWVGSRVRAFVDEGRADAFELDGIEAQWDVRGTHAAHVTGRARARIDEALAWLRAHPELQEHAPLLQDLVVQGNAIFDFDVEVPAARASTRHPVSGKAKTHIAAALEGVELQLTPELPPVKSLRGSLAFDSGRLQRSTLTASWLGGPLTLKVAERRHPRGMAIQVQGFVDARKLVALSQLRDLPGVGGTTPWSGEFRYAPPSDAEPSQWQGHVDSTLVGIFSTLPAPLSKLADASIPLHVEISGAGDVAEVRASLAERLRSRFTLSLQGAGNWQLDSATLHTGGTTVEATAEADGTAVRVASDSLGLLTGRLVADAPGVAFTNVKWSREALSGEGSIQCAATLATCDARFGLNTDSAARALAGLGFRPDVAATQGTLKGQLTWQPLATRPWIETASGHLTLRLDDGVAHSAVATAGHPFPLLTVPALLAGIATPSGPRAMPAEELRFKRLDAEFDLRDGEAYTSDLHFDGDAEILMRGRTGLLARDYDHEAWVLRGEERIPASLRRLAATPRVAAAWMALRELLHGEVADRSHIVLHLRGSWSEPTVTLE